MTWEELDPLLDEMKELSKKYDVPMSAIALNWVMSKGAIPLGGARNAQQAEQVSKVCAETACHAHIIPSEREGDDIQVDERRGRQPQCQGRRRQDVSV